MLSSNPAQQRQSATATSKEKLIRPIRSNVSYLSKPKFVIWPPVSPACKQTAQVITLEALTSSLVGPPQTCPLVSLTLQPIQDICSYSDIDKYGKKVIRLDVRDDQDTIHNLLLPGAYLAEQRIDQRRHVMLDEGYLHSLLSSWEGKTLLEKALICGSAVTAEAAVAFSVRFGERRANTLGSNPSEALRKLRNEIPAVDALGPTIITVELDKNGVLHLHGAVVTKAPASEVKRALRRLGGKSGNLPFRNLFQVRIRHITSMGGWISYITKDSIDLPACESKKLIYMSRPLKTRGCAHLPVLRSFAEHKLGIRSDWRGKSSVYANPGAKLVSGATAGRTLQ